VQIDILHDRLNTWTISRNLQQHVRGVDNPVADALSRIEANAVMYSTPPLIDYHTMAKAQQTDQELNKLLTSSSSSSLKLVKIPLSMPGMSLV